MESPARWETSALLEAVDSRGDGDDEREGRGGGRAGIHLDVVVAFSLAVAYSSTISVLATLSSSTCMFNFIVVTDAIRPHAFRIVTACGAKIRRFPALPVAEMVP